MLLLMPASTTLLPHMSVHPASYGWLLTPRRTMTITGIFGYRYGIDNEVYALGDGFDSARYMRALNRIREVHGIATCLFATAPDVVADAAATMRQFGQWSDRIRELFPVALVAQNGLESMPVPWDDFDALFVGGSTAWKLGPDVARLIREAKEHSKWTHIGRINSPYRAMRLREMPDSIDGTAWAQAPDRESRKWNRWLAQGSPRQPLLPSI